MTMAFVSFPFCVGLCAAQLRRETTTLNGQSTLWLLPFYQLREAKTQVHRYVCMSTSFPKLKQTTCSQGTMVHIHCCSAEVFTADFIKPGPYKSVDAYDHVLKNVKPSQHTLGLEWNQSQLLLLAN